ncbi:MAG TPA: acyloxyacyl hydrolase [Hyphomicrobiaceae bacterium]|nr:acyloxyacyl hydrolase [Hyphomicrobiaceae bacterium]
MKALYKAGMASAAFAAIAIAGVPANAADLGSYGEGSVKDGYVPLPRVMASHGAGPCYLRGDVGYAWSNASARWPVNNPTFTGDADTDGIIDADEIDYTNVGNNVAHADLENTWLGEIGAGCGSGSRGLRAEVMLGFRGQRDFQGEPGVYNPGPTPGETVAGYTPDVHDPMHTSLKTYTLMLNAYYDIGKFGRFVPYVGAGIGAAYHQLNDIYFTGNPALTNAIHGNNDLSFAWALMAGVGIQLSDRAILDIGYRYLDAGSITSQRSDTGFYVNPAVKFDDLTSHEIKVGLRYHFGSGDCCDAMPMK